MTLYPSQASIAPMNTLRLLKTNEVNAPALVVAGSLPIKQLRYDASTDFRVYVLGVVPSGVVFPPLLDRPAGLAEDPSSGEVYSESVAGQKLPRSVARG